VEVSALPDAETSSLPTGTVTFLLTDVEGSTRLWQEAPGEMAVAIARHYEILDSAVAFHGGVRPQEQGEGDSIVGAFANASDAICAAVAAQIVLLSESWPTTSPVRVRMAIHTGEAQLRDESNYVGLAIIRTARLRTLAHGGQILVSAASRAVAADQLQEGLTLHDLGEHRLKDLTRPERVYELRHPDLPSDFPVLRSLDSAPANVPSSQPSSPPGQDAPSAARCRRQCPPI
jgi:class 3 adenylate cyclase